MIIQGIIFDFNGTLFEDSKLHEQAWRDYSKFLRGTPFSDEEMQKYMFGRSNEEIITYAIGRKPTKEECLKLLELIKNPSFYEIANNMSYKEAIIIGLKLGFVDELYFWNGLH